MSFRVSAFYKFVPFAEPEAIRADIAARFETLGIRGTVLVAAEGLNGTIAAEGDALDEAMSFLRALPGCDTLEHKESHAETMPFWRLKVRLKQEIVTMGVPGTDPNNLVGTYVDPQDWNNLITDPDTVLIDTRNDYEYGIGTFEGAIDPNTATFREFPDWFRDFRTKLEAEGRKPKIAMFCTGGIRCEKATAYVKELGHENVFHLKGGILRYLEEMPEEKSLWKGECFVFDERVGIKHGLELGEYISCHACGRGVSPEGQKSPNYVAGVSCDYCIDEFTENDRERFRQRQYQLKLAKERGEAGMGPEAQPDIKRKARADAEAQESGEG